MDQAFLLGLVGSSSLLVGAGIALIRPLGHRTLGLVMAFGCGVLISAVAYELVAEAFVTASGEGTVALGLLLGAIAFYIGSVIIERRTPPASPTATGAESAGSALAIVLGTVLDGIPESVVLGVGVASTTTQGPAMLIAVFVSNLPEAMASTAGLRSAGWATRSIVLLWTCISVASAASAAAGYAISSVTSPAGLAFALAFAAGAILTMLADSMMPEAFDHGGRSTGVVTTIGFGVSFALSAL